MVRRTHIGWRTPQQRRQAFESLRPFRSHVIKLQMVHFPYNDDYKALQRIVQEIDAAARHFGLDAFELYSAGDTGHVGKGYREPD